MSSDWDNILGDSLSEQHKTKTYATAFLLVLLVKTAAVGAMIYLSLFSLRQIFELGYSMGFVKYLWSWLLAFALVFGRATLMAGMEKN